MECESCEISFLMAMSTHRALFFCYLMFLGHCDMIDSSLGRARQLLRLL